MIVVCKKCYTPYLVADTLLNKRGRKVRCAKCKHVWIEVPIHKPMKRPPNIKEALTVPKNKIIEQTQVIKQKTKEALKVDNLRKHLLLALKISTFILVLSLLGFLFGQQILVTKWPSLQRIYISIGWVKEKHDDLILYDISSERRYIDGAMQLVIKGNIRCTAEKTQVIPYINADGVGPDGSIIQSWRIDPPQATLKPKKTVPFRSVVIAPEGTITEINLSFVEKSHDKED